MGGEHLGDKDWRPDKIYGRPNQVTTAQEICVSYPNFVTDVTVGTHVLIDDGPIDLLVKSKDDECLLCESQNDALLGNRKSGMCQGEHQPALGDRTRQEEHTVSH